MIYINHHKPALNQKALISQEASHFIITWLLLGGMMLLTFLLGLFLFGIYGGIYGLALSGLIFILTPKVSQSLITKALKARKLSQWEADDLYVRVASLAHKAGLDKVPDLYYMVNHVPNAFSFGVRHSPAIAMTSGLLDRINKREFDGVMAHEISHIKNNDMHFMMFGKVMSHITQLFAHIYGFIVLISLPLMLSSYGFLGIFTILIAFTAPLLMNTMYFALSRTREYEADLDAVRLSGDPMGLASALTKLSTDQYSLFGLLTIFRPRPKEEESTSINQTHPKLQERIKRLQSYTFDQYDSALKQQPEQSIHPRRPFFLI